MQDLYHQQDLGYQEQAAMLQGPGVLDGRLSSGLRLQAPQSSLP